jgi:nucleotide-binding universal stress UspA family protein
MADLLDRIVVPVASAADARATGRAIRSDDSSTVVAVHVIEQTAGTPDTASPERLEERALEIFDELAAVLGATEFETDLRYGTDVGETIIEAAGDHDATAVVFTPRGGSRWIRLLTGSVAETLVERADRPVVVLPDVDSED